VVPGTLSKNVLGKVQGARLIVKGCKNSIAFTIKGTGFRVCLVAAVPAAHDPTLFLAQLVKGLRFRV